MWFFDLNQQLPDERIRAEFPHLHISRKSPATVRRADSCWVPSSAPFSQVTCKLGCNCQTSRFVLGALLVICTFFASHLQPSDERICAGCPHSHFYRKSPATARRADLCRVPTVPSSAPFSQVTCYCQTGRFVLDVHIRTFPASSSQA